MTFSNQYALKVDIKRRLSSVVPTFKQGDNGILKFQIFDDGKKYDLSDYTYSEITFRLPSGQSVIGNPILGVDGVLTYNFTGVEMSEVGKIETILSIYSASTMVSVQPFTCFIYDSMKGEDLSYIGILQELIAEVQSLKQEVIDTTNLANKALVDSNNLKNEFIDLNNNVIAEEQIRNKNENDRKTNESTRASEEQKRKNNETTRISNESTRASEEQKRKNNETTRISNETQRQSDFNSKVNTINTKVSEAQTLIDDSVSVGLFNINTQYKKNNRVLNNGSTWVAKVDTINNPLPNLPTYENTWWILEAQRGTDGTGAVSKVNGVSPDATGNVTLSIPTEWVDIKNKPTTFTPTSHTHTVSQVSGLQTELNKIAILQQTVTEDKLEVTEHLAGNPYNSHSILPHLLAKDVATQSVASNQWTWLPLSVVSSDAITLMGDKALISEDGFYLVNVNSSWEVNSTSFRQLQAVKNNVGNVAFDTSLAISTSNQSVAGVVYCVAGDFIRLRVYHGVSSPQTVDYTLSIVRVA